MRYTIKQKREALGWTQERLSVETAIPRRQVSRHENNERGPTYKQREAYALAFGCDPYDLDVLPHRAGGRPVREGRAYLERFRRQETYDPTYGRPSERYLPAARDAYPRLMGEIDRTMATDTRIFLQRAPAGSSVETVFQALTLRREGLPSDVSPQEVGFDRWPVVERETDRVVGHCRVPAIVTRNWVMIFQVTVKTPRSTYTMDALVVVLHPRRFCFNLEVDGRGHDATWDARRQADLNMPVLRLTEAEVLADVRLTDRLRTLGYCLDADAAR